MNTNTTGTDTKANVDGSGTTTSRASLDMSAFSSHPFTGTGPFTVKLNDPEESTIPD
jgi:hypothetical protein